MPEAASEPSHSISAGEVSILGGGGGAGGGRERGGKAGEGAVCAVMPHVYSRWSPLCETSCSPNWATMLLLIIAKSCHHSSQTAEPRTDCSRLIVQCACPAAELPGS